jgi:hypothetical protein
MKTVTYLKPRNKEYNGKNAIESNCSSTVVADNFVITRQLKQRVTQVLSNPENQQNTFAR